MKTVHLYILLTFTVLVACSKDTEDSLIVTDSPAIRLICSINGMGDRSYTDNIYEGLCRVREKHRDKSLVVETYSPTDMDMAEAAIQDWFDDRFSSRQLLIVGDPLLGTLFDKHPEWTSRKNAEIFIIDSWRDDLDVYTRFLPLYGVSHLAGQAIGQMGVERTALMLANREDLAISECAQGFADGLHMAGKEFDTKRDVWYVSESTGTGYSDPDKSYRMCYEMDRLYDFIVPVCGGSSMGVFRYTREFQNNPDCFYTCGLDVDQQNFSTRIAFSLMKRCDLALEDFADDWLANRLGEKHLTQGVGTKYVELKVADRYQGSIGESSPYSALWLEAAQKAEEAFYKSTKALQVRE